MTKKREEEEEEAELKVPETPPICSHLLEPSIQSGPKSVNSPETLAPARSPPPADQKRREINRCAGCRRKVGLTGFRCRCGDLFCTEHRYSDCHDCSFDYKAAGRAAIARDNPVVRPAKILKV